jgi:hypothetical protein
MNLCEYDLRLYVLLRRCLTGDYVSPAADRLTSRMRRGMLAELKTLQVARCCTCGQSDCFTFYTSLVPSADAELFRIRFHVHGELMVHCDADGRIYKVEWLPEEARPGAVVARRRRDGQWEIAQVAAPGAAKD